MRVDLGDCKMYVYGEQLREQHLLSIDRGHGKHRVIPGGGQRPLWFKISCGTLDFVVNWHSPIYRKEFTD